MITYRYDAYGNTTKSNNTLNNPYQYNAEYTDSSTELQYLRARYYDSSQGRFTTKDTYLGTIPNPLSRNLYTYVENNPLNYIDPSGHKRLGKKGKPVASSKGAKGFNAAVIKKSTPKKPVDFKTALNYTNSLNKSPFGRYSYQVPVRGSVSGTLTTRTNSIMQLALAERHRQMCESYTTKAKDTGKGYDYSPLYNTSAIYGYSTDVFTGTVDTIADWSIWGAENAQNINNMNPQLWLDSQNQTIKTANDMKEFNGKFSTGLTIVSGIYDINKNIKENEANNSSSKKVIIDIIVDSLDVALTYGVGEAGSAIAVTAVTAAIGAAGGSVAPGVGNAIGLVAGIAAGIAFTYYTNVKVNDNGNTVSDEVRKYLYDLAGVN